MKIAERQNNFNLLRLVLALLVLLSHAPEIIDGDRSREWLTRVFGSLSSGELAVDGFFLLSGYLIVQSWNQQPQAWPFLKKRLLRIFPGFVMATLVCGFVVGPLASDPAAYFAELDVPALFGNMVFLQKPAVPAVFVGLHHEGINNSMWSISAEFVCYLGVLAAGVAGMFQRKHMWLYATLTVFALAVILKLTGVAAPGVRLAMLFLSGGSYYLYRDRIVYRGDVAICLGAIVCAGMFSWRAAEIVVASVGAYTLLYLAGKRSATLSKFNRLPDVSYGTYLYGWPIQKLLLWNFPDLSPLGLIALSVPAALAAGTLSWYLIEKPALRFKGPALSAPSPVQPVALS